jgi:Protein of unknown function (DUF3224)
MAQAIGTFELVSGSEDAYLETEGEARLTHAHGVQRFSGDIEGEGSVEWLMCCLPGGGARFVGMQRIAGSLGGRAGSFLVEATGSHDGSQSTATWEVIAGSGTGALAGISGKGGFHAPGGRIVSYHLEYELGV